MRLSRPAAIAGAALLVGGLGFSSADAAGSLSKTDLLPQGETITVFYNNMTIPAGNSNVVYIQQCVKNDSGPFNQLFDCSQATGINPDYPGTGEALFAVFGGDDPNLGEWGCGPNTSSGVPAAATCYVRLAPGSASNTATDEFYPVTFTAVVQTTTTVAPTTTVVQTTTTVVDPTTTVVDPTTTVVDPTTTVVPPNDVPEVPMNVLLPLGAIAVLGGTVVLARRRQHNAA
jgi:hypothetical protein